MRRAAEPGASRRLAERSGAFLQARSTRRGFLAKVAVVGSALAAAPAAFVLRPGSAYAAICGPDNTCADGYSVFCCSIFRGMNKCPPGTFVGGWWKADNSAFCCSDGERKARYYIDCNARCTRCRTGCADSFCSSSCWNCSCRCNDNDTCDARRVCCNVFRYGQCHQEVGCAGPVACRVVSCTPPYRLYDSCGSTSATDNRTAAHSAPCLAGRCA